MTIEQSTPGGVPREKMWILPSALEDIQELDHSLQVRLQNELRKRFFNLEHIATRVMPSLYRIRLGDQYRATVHKDHDQYFIMHVIPKKDDQRYYRSSRLPSYLEMEEAQRLPQPIESAPVETMVMPANGKPVDRASDVDPRTPPPDTNGHVALAGVSVPAPIQDAMQKLQSVFLFFAKEQDELLRTISAVSDHSRQSDQTSTEDRRIIRNEIATLAQNLESLRDQQTSLKAECTRWSEIQDRIDTRVTNVAEHFDAALEIAAGQIQTLEGKHTDLTNQLESERQTRQATVTDLLGNWTQFREKHELALSTLQINLDQWTKAYQETQLTQVTLQGQCAELAQTLAVTSQRLTEGQQAEVEQQARTAAAQLQSQQQIIELKTRLASLESRLKQAERRSFWDWLWGR